MACRGLAQPETNHRNRTRPRATSSPPASAHQVIAARSAHSSGDSPCLESARALHQAVAARPVPAGIAFKAEPQPSILARHPLFVRSGILGDELRAATRPALRPPGFGAADRSARPRSLGDSQSTTGSSRPIGRPPGYRRVEPAGRPRRLNRAAVIAVQPGRVNHQRVAAPPLGQSASQVARDPCPDRRFPAASEHPRPARATSERAIRARRPRPPSSPGDSESRPWRRRSDRDRRPLVPTQRAANATAAECRQSRPRISACGLDGAADGPPRCRRDQVQWAEPGPTVD